MSGTNYNSACS